MPPRSKKTPAIQTDTAPAPVEPPQELVISEPSPAAEPASEVEHHRKKRRPNRRSSDTGPVVPTAVFRRLVREITQDVNSDLRWEAEALEALQVDAEAYLMQRFGEADKKRDMCKSRTLKKIQFVVA